MAKSQNRPIREGVAYIAEVTTCPFAYRKIKGSKSSKGEMVWVKSSRIVDIEWKDGSRNSVPRSCLRVIGEA